MYSIALSIALTMHTSVTDYNPIHPHIRIEKEGIIAGAYYNSVNRASLYIGRRFEYGRTFVDVGAVTGYEKPVLPMMIAGYRFSDRISAIASPVVDGNGLSFLAGVEFKFY